MSKQAILSMTINRPHLQQADKTMILQMGEIIVKEIGNPQSTQLINLELQVVTLTEATEDFNSINPQKVNENEYE